MTYMIDQAEKVARQLEKFSDGYDHHVVGQHANLEFWLDEAVHALAALDGYQQRFERMADAQRDWVAAHDTKVGSYCAICRGACELEDKKMHTPPPPTRYPAKERAKAARRLRDAAYSFLHRCYRMALIDEAGFRAGCERVGTSVETADLRDEP